MVGELVGGRDRGMLRRGAQGTEPDTERHVGSPTSRQTIMRVRDQAQSYVAPRTLMRTDANTAGGQLGGKTTPSGRLFLHRSQVLRGKLVGLEDSV